MKVLNFPDEGQDINDFVFDELCKYVAKSQIRTVESSYQDKPPEQILVRELEHGPFDLVTGTGFGALFAMAAGQMLGCRTVLINPLYPPFQNAIEYAESYEFKGELKRITFDLMCSNNARKELIDTYVILGEDDDQIDVKSMPGYFPKGHCFVVAGEHYPEGAEFSETFGRLTGLEKMTRQGLAVPIEPGWDDRALPDLIEFVEGKTKVPTSVYCPYVHFEEDSLMLSKTLRKLERYLKHANPETRVCYWSLDELPTLEVVREIGKRAGLLILDNVNKITVTPDSIRALWAICDEVLINDGKIIIASCDELDDLLEDDPAILALLKSGLSVEYECHDENGDITTYFDECNGFITPKRSRTPESVRIDEVIMQTGQFQIYWSFTDDTPRCNHLFLYCQAGEWKWEMDGGRRFDDSMAAIVLQAASKKIIEQSERVGYSL